MSEQQPEAVEQETTEEPEPETRQERRDQHVRQQLREVEAERDALRQRIDARDRASVESAAKAALGERGSSLFSYDLAALRDDDGNLDPELVEQAIEPVRAALDEGRVQHHGDMGARRTAPTRKGASWDQLLGR
jgi:hypothetical protein